MAISLAIATAQAKCNAAVDRIDSGSGTAKLRIYTGTKPASADTAATGTLLYEFDLPNPAFGNATNASPSVATANAISPAVGLDNGTAGWGRVFNRNGDAVFDGTVGQEITLNSTTVSTGLTGTVTSFTYVQPTA